MSMTNKHYPNIEVVKRIAAKDMFAPIESIKSQFVSRYLYQQLLQRLFSSFIFKLTMKLVSLLRGNRYLVCWP
jgi:hypothetical protein